MQLHVTDRVSATMKWLGIGVLVVAIIAAVWYLQRPTPKTVAATESAPPKPAPITKVTRLGSVEERKLLADRIEQARAERSTTAAKTGAKTGTSGTAMATHAPAPPRLPDDLPPAISHVQIKSAMRDVIGLITECYEAAIPTLADPHLEIEAELTLTGDPDIGTVIDAKQISDKTGKPLPAKLDDCLRSTFQTLALPPLAEGDTIEVRYPFMFDKI